MSQLRSLRFLWSPLLAFSLTRLGIVLVAYFSSPIIADSIVPPYHIRPDNVILDALGSRWDTGFYLEIAEHGYTYIPGEMSSVAFFPLLPMLMRPVTALTGDPLIAGLLVTNLALLGAMILLYQLVEMTWGARIADRTVWYMLIFPVSFFGSAIYSESLFLLGSIGTLYLARKQHWIGAALLAVLTALTRLMGLILAPMLLVEWWSQRRASSQEQRPGWLALLAPAAVPLGTGLYMLYLQQVFGDPLAFMHASAAWVRTPASPLTLIVDLLQKPAQGWGAAILSGSLPLDNWLDLGFVLAFLGLGVVLLYQRQWSEGTFVMLGALLSFSSGMLMSQRRYMWVLFPVFILLARWGKHLWVDRALTILFLLGLGLFTALFANWYWVG